MGFGASCTGGVGEDLDAAFLRDVSAFLSSSAPAAAPSTAASDSGSGSGGHNLEEGEGDKQTRQRALAAKRRRAYRERSAAELQGLRQEVAALEQQVVELSQRSGAERSLVRSGIPAGGRRTEGGGVWQELAVRQREGRLAAERLQKRLKTQVVARQAFIQDIAGSITQKAACPSFEAVVALPTPASSSVDVAVPAVKLASSSCFIELADEALFEAYLDELDDAFAQTDTVLRESGVAALPDETRHQQIHRRTAPTEEGDEGEDYYEIVDSLVVPFRFDAVRAILWNAVARVHARPERAAYKGVQEPENTIAVKFSLNCRPRDESGSDSSVPLVIILVLRRYVEANREVLVWRAFSEGSGAVEGLSSDETGWSVVRPAKMTEDSPFGTDATINQTIVRFHTIRVDPHEGNSTMNGMDISVGGGRRTVGSPPADEELFAKLVASSADEDGEQISMLMAQLMLQDGNEDDGKHSAC